MLALRNTLSASNSVDLDDVKPVKSALQSFGFYKTPSYGMNEYPDIATFDGIKKYQKSRGLRVDGVMNPGGETERAMNKELRPISAPKPKPKPQTPAPQPLASTLKARPKPAPNQRRSPTALSRILVFGPIR